MERALSLLTICLSLFASGAAATALFAGHPGPAFATGLAATHLWLVASHIRPAGTS